MLTIEYNGSIPVLIDAVQRANTLLSDNSFYNLIEQKPGFYFTTASGEDVANSIKKCNLFLTVKTYKKLFSRALGYELPSDPTSVHINIAGNKLNRSVGSITGTFIHEAVHAADSDDEIMDYQHDGNSSAGNEDTAPYWIGNLAIQLIDQPSSPVNINAIVAVPHSIEEEMASI